jgi:hypothetical protein
MELLNISAYDSPVVMVILFVTCGISLLLILIIRPDNNNQAPMNYYLTKKTELPEDDTYEKSSRFLWILLIMAIILYLIL